MANYCNEEEKSDFAGEDSSRKRFLRCLCFFIIVTVILSSSSICLSVIFYTQRESQTTGAVKQESLAEPTGRSQRLAQSLSYPRQWIDQDSEPGPDKLAVSAHKILVSPVGKTDTRTLSIRQAFDDDRYEHVHGVLLTHNGLMVQYAGMYYVYKSIYVIPFYMSSKCGASNRAIYRSSIRRKNGDGIQNLLTTLHPLCQERQTSFAGGVFELEPGDVIQVRVSQDLESHVYFSNDVTYMGLTMLQAL